MSRSAFAERQLRFAERLRQIGLPGLEAGTIVVAQSLSFPLSEAKKIIGIERYEERMLCMLLLLKEPGVRIVYVTSMPIDEEAIAYYLSFVGDPAARERLQLVSVNEPGPRPLAEKLLGTPQSLTAIRAAVRDRDDAYLLPFNVTPLEKALAEALGIPLYGPDLELVPLGSKTGARRIAQKVRVPVLDGAEGLHSVPAVLDSLVALRARRPDARAAVIKLNNGFSGQGNAVVDLGQLGDRLEAARIVFCASEESWVTYSRKISSEGAIVEELAAGRSVISPSVQMRVAPGGEFEIVSTHDQILGGPDNQVYLGCRFPATEAYRREIQDHACRVAQELATRGVIGSFGVDFVVVGEGARRGAYLTEINLRLGGTTHPFLMARLATGGRYDVAAGHLVAGRRPKFYVATDNLKSESYKRLSPRQLIAALNDRRLAFDTSTRTGATLHLLGALSDYGKLGTLCIGDSAAEADELYEGVLAAVDELAAR